MRKVSVSTQRPHLLTVQARPGPCTGVISCLCVRPCHTAYASLDLGAPHMHLEAFETGPQRLLCVPRCSVTVMYGREQLLWCEWQMRVLLRCCSTTTQRFKTRIATSAGGSVNYIKLQQKINPLPTASEQQCQTTLGQQLCAIYTNKMQSTCCLHLMFEYRTLLLDAQLILCSPLLLHLMQARYNASMCFYS